MDVADLLHPDELIHNLRLNKHRCFVITNRPLEGKTRPAQAMAARYHGQRLDSSNNEPRHCTTDVQPKCTRAERALAPIV
jgi:hypothetical protein